MFKRYWAVSSVAVTGMRQEPLNSRRNLNSYYGTVRIKVMSTTMR